MPKAEEIVKAWQESESAIEAAKKLGMNPDDLRNRASLYRSRGVKLKMMPRTGGRKTLDIDALNKLAKESLKESLKE